MQEMIFKKAYLINLPPRRIAYKLSQMIVQVYKIYSVVIIPTKYYCKYIMLIIHEPIGIN
jgi:hypothetical protein